MSASIKFSLQKISRLFFITFVLLAHTILLTVIYKWFPFRGNDLLTNLAQPTFFINSIKAGIFPAINPYLGYGLPLWLDPLNMVWNPLVFSALHVLNTHTAIVTMYMIVLWTSGCAMYVVARKAECRTIFAIPIALNYMSTGYLCGAIYTGHLEKILVWPVMPLVLLIIFKLSGYHLTDYSRQGFMSKTLLLALLITYVISSSSYYALLGIFLVIAINILITWRMGIIWAVLIACILSAPKLITNIIGMALIPRNYSPAVGAPNIVQLIESLFTYKYSYILSGQHLGWWEYSGGIGIIYLAVLFVALVYGIKHRQKPKNLPDIRQPRIGLNLITLITWLCIACTIVVFHYFPQYAELFSKLRIPTRLYIVLIPLTYILGVRVFLSIQFSKWAILIVIILYLNIASQYVNIIEKNKDNFLNFVDIQAQADVLDVIDRMKPGARIITDSYFGHQLATFESINRKQILINPPYAFYIGSNPWEEFVLIRDKNRNHYSGQIPDFFVLPKAQSKMQLPPIVFNSELVYSNSKYSVFAYTGLNTNHYSNEK